MLADLNTCPGDLIVSKLTGIIRFCVIDELDHFLCIVSWPVCIASGFDHVHKKALEFNRAQFEMLWKS